MSVMNGPGEGTWSVFAEKMMEQRDAAREELKKAIDEKGKANVASVKLVLQRDDLIDSIDAIRKRMDACSDHKAKADVERIIALVLHRIAEV